MILPARASSIDQTLTSIDAIRKEYESILDDLDARKQAHSSLHAFCRYTHPAWEDAEHHRLICELLERVERGEVKRAIIEAPPRHGKSEITSRRFPAWCMGRNPTREIISTAYGEELAVDEYGRKVRNIMRDPRFWSIFPDVTLADDSQAAGRWNTNKGGGYIARGVGSGITGRGANIILVDDPFKGREEADSQRERARVWSWYDSELKTRLAPGGSIVIINTRWHEEDLTGMVLKHHADEGWVELKLPAIKHEDTDHEEALWPGRFGIDYLRALRANYLKSHPREWYSLYQQDPRPEQGTYMQRAWFNERYEKKPDPINVYMASDFAVTVPKEGMDRDFTEHGVFGLSQEKIYVLDWWHGQTSSDKWIEALIDLFAKWKPLGWFGEGGVIRHAIEPFLMSRMRQRKTYCQPYWLNPIHNKAIEGRSFQGQAGLGNIILPKTSPWVDRLLAQWVAFGSGAGHDDAFDVAAKMCRAIDEAHPAIMRPKAQQKKANDYSKKRKAIPNGWKVV